MEKLLFADKLGNTVVNYSCPEIGTKMQLLTYFRTGRKTGV
jgi:hypothetical protein